MKKKKKKARTRHTWNYWSSVGLPNIWNITLQILYYTLEINTDFNGEFYYKETHSAFFFHSFQDDRERTWNKASYGGADTFFLTFRFETPFHMFEATFLGGRQKYIQSNKNDVHGKGRSYFHVRSFIYSWLIKVSH